MRTGRLPGTIRFRITAIAAVAVAVVLSIVGVVMVILVRRELYVNLDNSLAQRADTYEASSPSEVGDLPVFGNTNDEDLAAQLVGADGGVIASTPNLDGIGALAESPPADGDVVRTVDVPQLDNDPFRVLSRTVGTGASGRTLHVAQNSDDLVDIVRGLVLGLLVGVPVVAAVLATLVWALVGRTLRPVELIRAEVDDISGSDLARRLPVPDQADEIARLAGTMNQMLERIDVAGRRQRQFVADASHELRTPLTRIRTELEVDVSQPELADPVTTTTEVLGEVVALQDLLDNLLFLARSDEGQLLHERRPVDLDDVVLREVQRARAESPVEIDTSRVSAAHVEGDATQLSRLVRNLLSNAVRHANGRVDVALSESIGSVSFSVTDDGPGVPVAARERIFERFGRGDDARARDEGGAGLGLAIVSDIVRRHAGSVRYDDSFNGGARFVVELPGPGDPARERSTV